MQEVKELKIKIKNQRSIYGVPATIEAVEYLTDKLRSEDINELKALGRTSETTLINSFKQSHLVWVGMFEDKPFCVFGVAAKTLLSSTGYIWLLGTDDMKDKRIALQYLYGCKDYFKEMFKFYDVLINYVHVENKTAIKWIKWLGAKLYKPESRGINGEKFIKFELHKGDFR